MRGDERGVDDAPFAGLDLQEVRADRLEERLIAAHPDLHEPIGELRPAQQHAAGRLGVLEAHESRLGQRVDGDDRRPFCFAFSSALSMRG